MNGSNEIIKFQMKIETRRKLVPLSYILFTVATVGCLPYGAHHLFKTFFFFFNINIIFHQIIKLIRSRIQRKYQQNVRSTRRKNLCINES